MKNTFRVIENLSESDIAFAWCERVLELVKGCHTTNIFDFPCGSFPFFGQQKKLFTTTTHQRHIPSMASPIPSKKQDHIQWWMGGQQRQPHPLHWLTPYNEFGYNEHLAITSRFLCINIIDCNVKKFAYNEHPLVTNSFFCIILLVVSGTQCNWMSINWNLLQKLTATSYHNLGRSLNLKKIYKLSWNLLFCLAVNILTLVRDEWIFLSKSRFDDKLTFWKNINILGPTYNEHLNSWKYAS